MLTSSYSSMCITLICPLYLSMSLVDKCLAVIYRFLTTRVHRLQRVMSVSEFILLAERVTPLLFCLLFVFFVVLLRVIQPWLQIMIVGTSELKVKIGGANLKHQV